LIAKDVRRTNDHRPLRRRDIDGLRDRYDHTVAKRWLSRRALCFHFALAIWVPGCAVAAWWQVTVALAGDRLADLYSVEWPVFGIFGVVFWWHMIHDDPETIGARGLARARRLAEEKGETLGDAVTLGVRRKEDEDEELSAYNDYLAELASANERKSWRKP
jgi:hypothetical protein